MAPTKTCKKPLPLRFVFSGDDDTNSALMLCLVCGCGEVHIGPVSVEQGTFTTIVDRERAYVAPSNRHQKHRGSAVSLRFHCEWGHVFAYSVSFHKGSTTLSLDAAEYDQEKHGPSELWRD